jgi:phosphoribosyl-AMP cyclohydrolase
MTEIPVTVDASSALKLRRAAAWRGIRVLAWDSDILYGGRGYQIVRLQTQQVDRRHIGEPAAWEAVASFRPVWWRSLTSRTAMSYRLMRDGYHALAILNNRQTNDRTMVGAVPGALVTRTPGNNEFHITHRVQRGIRPLHVTPVPSGNIYWGEYFDNRERAEVHIYVSTDRGCTWQIAYTFPAGSIRHVHNIVYDRWGDCLWILTGDEGAECKVLRADCDLRSVEVVLTGNQQARAVAAIPTQNGLYLSTDTPFEKNHVYRLDRAGNVGPVGDLASSSIFGCKVNCKVGDAMFFSTMVEPSAVNTGREVHLAGSRDGTSWQVLASWKKDNLPMRYFQYGNAFLPDGENSTNYLAATTIAVDTDDLVTTLWEVEPA